MPTATEAPGSRSTTEAQAVKQERSPVKDGSSDRSPQEAAVLAASQPNPVLSEEQVQSATEWFLSDEMEAPTILYVDVDVAAAGMPSHYIRWGLRALQRAEIREIRKNAVDEETGLEDDMEVNMRVLIRASIDPDFREVAQKKGVADPADIVNRRFGHKPGVIEAVARKANEMAGYGNAKIIRPVDAAGN